MKRLIFLTFVLFLAVCFTTSGYAYWIWTPKTGKFINPKWAVKDTPEDQLYWAMNFYKAEDYDRAIKEFKKLVQHFSRAKQAADAQFYVGLCYEKLGYYYEAYKAYQKTIEEYPYTQRFDEVLDREFKMAEYFYGGAKHKYMGIALYPSYDKAAEIFKKVAENAPFSKRADTALYKAGESYKKAGSYEEATLAFIKLTNDYPDSKLVDTAKFQAAYCSLKASGKPGYDPAATDQAITEFEKFVGDNPDTDFSKDAGDALNVLYSKKAEEAFNVGQFYEKQNEPESAEIYYKEIVEKYPRTKWVKDAIERLRVIYAQKGEEWLTEDNEPAFLPKKQSSSLIVLPNAKQELVRENLVFIKDIKVRNEKDFAEVKIILSGKLEASSFSLDNPSRVVVDPIGPVYTKLKEKQKPSKGIVKEIKILAAEKEGPVKVKTKNYPVDLITVNLRKLAKCDVVQNANSITLFIGEKH